MHGAPGNNGLMNYRRKICPGNSQTPTPIFSSFTYEGLVYLRTCPTTGCRNGLSTTGCPAQVAAMGDPQQVAQVPRALVLVKKETREIMSVEVF